MSTRRDREVTDAFWLQVLAELTRYRKEPAHTSHTKLLEYPALLELSTHEDSYDSYSWLIDTARGFITRGDKELTAAVKATFGSGDSVLERLDQGAELLHADQRSVRRWADAGMTKLASALVDESYMTGRRGIHIVDVGYMVNKAGDCLLMMLKWNALAVALTGSEFIEFRLEKLDAPDLEDAYVWGTQFIPEWEQSPEQATVASSSLFTELPVFPGNYRLVLYFHAAAPPFFTQLGAPDWNGNFCKVTAHRQYLTFQWLNDNARWAALNRMDADYEERLILGDVLKNAGIPLGSADLAE